MGSSKGVRARQETGAGEGLALAGSRREGG